RRTTTSVETATVPTARSSPPRGRTRSRDLAAGTLCFGRGDAHLDRWRAIAITSARCRARRPVPWAICIRHEKPFATPTSPGQAQEPVVVERPAAAAVALRYEHPPPCCLHRLHRGDGR